MTGKRALVLVIALALVAMAGIVGMLLAEGRWDGVCFIMAILPLAAGLGCWWRWHVPRPVKQQRP